MHSSLAFDLAIADSEPPFDRRMWKNLLLSSLARSGEGLAIWDEDLRLLFSTPRAVHLLGRLGMGPERRLPPLLVNLVTPELFRTEASRTRRFPTPPGGAICVHYDPLRGAGSARFALWLKSETLRDDELFAKLRERYGVSARDFKLAQLVRRGLSNRQIAQEMRLTESTVKVYLHRLYKECSVSSRTSLVALLERG